MPSTGTAPFLPVFPTLLAYCFIKLWSPCYLSAGEDTAHFCQAGPTLAPLPTNVTFQKCRSWWSLCLARHVVSMVVAQFLFLYLVSSSSVPRLRSAVLLGGWTGLCKSAVSPEACREWTWCWSHELWTYSVWPLPIWSLWPPFSYCTCNRHDLLGHRNRL